jgi:hypothetical protein
MIEIPMMVDHLPEFFDALLCLLSGHARTNQKYEIRNQEFLSALCFSREAPLSGANGIPPPFDEETGGGTVF